MDGLVPRRAQRYEVSWPARVRRGDQGEWVACRTVNLSVSGVLLRTHRDFKIGERVEVEIEFLATVQSKSIISGAGQVVRHDPAVPGGAAISFLMSPSGLSESSIAPN
jgi:hypothetical protein